MPNQSRKVVTLDEKIKIFERFFEEGNNEIAGKTVFEGYPIGQWAINIRSLLNTGRNSINPTEEQLDKLSELGILERRIDSTIDEKIEAVIDWYKKHPDIDIKRRTNDNKGVNGDTIEKLEKLAEEEGIDFSEIEKQYDRIQRYYEYIRERDYKGKLTEEQRNKCKEGGLGGRFGISTNSIEHQNMVKELIEKYQISEEEADNICRNLEEKSNFISQTYGSLESLVESYNRWKLGYESKKDDGGFKFRYIGNIDIDATSNSVNYAQLVDDIFGYMEKRGEIRFYSSVDIDELLHKFDPEEEKIIREIYGLDEEEPKEDIINLGSINKELMIKLEQQAMYEGVRTFGFQEIINSRKFSDEELIQLGKLQCDILNSNLFFNNSSEIDFDVERLGVVRDIIDDIRNRIKQYGIASEDICFNEELSRAGIFCWQDLEEVTRKKIDEITIDDMKKIEYIKMPSAGKYENFMKDKLYLDYSEESILSLINDEINLYAGIPIEDMYLSAKTFSFLKFHGIRTLERLGKLTLEDLRKIDGIDERSLEEIVSKSEEYGVHICENEEEREPANIVKEEIVIEDMGLGTRAYKCLKAEGIETLVDLEKLTLEDIRNLSGLGEKSIEEIISKAEEYGIHIYESQEEREAVNKILKEEREPANIVKEEIAIEDMGLGTRAYKCLKAEGIETLADLEKLTLEELKIMSGKKTIDEIISKAEEYGIHIYADKEQRERIEKLAARQLTGQDIGKATFDAPTQECDEVQGALTRDILMQKSNNRGEQN